eukprot:CAMPEP_0172356980 /NCGR_PEP_ID=MMETSP1060-20121228/1342_1 /TAXON_ID=37318 /ORGANISM="Pseudo-nitzschia pungens, Strain cf. cingulata" /LENGTH=386 /DNA_ID=CAMNT_0013077401 /DNA_START=26 /DNA_END=1183 /DNA_ORIENTATION=+
MNIEPNMPDEVLNRNLEPASPIAFPHATLRWGRWSRALVRDGNTEIEAEEFLFEDFSRQFLDYDEDDREELAMDLVTEAYWPVPGKPTQKTIAGYAQLCYVVTRDAEGNTDEIVFQFTRRLVVVKVSRQRKCIELAREGYAENPFKELDAMQMIGNENSRLMGVITALMDGKNLNVVMPYGGTDIFYEIQRRPNGRFTENEARPLFREMVEGLQFLHRKGISHRDLSVENILIKNNSSIIIDMGQAIRVPYTDHLNNRVTDIFTANQRRQNRPLERRLVHQRHKPFGKAPYMPPEAHNFRLHYDGPSVDVWTTGTILFYMLTGDKPYENAGLHDIRYVWLTTKLRRYFFEVYTITPCEECLDLMTNILQPDPSMRPTVEEILNHQW